MTKEVITTQDLTPGDVVDLEFASGGYGTATVIRVTNDKMVRLFRPYVHFDVASGVEYIGTETFDIFRGSHEHHNRIVRVGRAK